VRDFSGSLDAKTFSRGVLMTTSRFTKGAEAYVRATPKPIALIDGAELTRLMIEHRVGVRQSRANAPKKVDAAYFKKSRDGQQLHLPERPLFSSG
jgi:restriction system protein